MSGGRSKQGGFGTLGVLVALAAGVPMLAIAAVMVFVVAAAPANLRDAGQDRPWQDYGDGFVGQYSLVGSVFVDLGSAGSAWGGHGNGAIPADELCTPTWDATEALRCDAADALEALNTAFRTDFGRNLALTDTYRSFARQQQMRAYWCGRGQCHMAATPGTSNHGWAVAIDFGGGINAYFSPEYEWMKTNAWRFGYFHPTWAEPGHGDYRLPEPWHWQYLPATTSLWRDGLGDLVLDPVTGMLRDPDGQFYDPNTGRPLDPTNPVGAI